MNYSPLYQVDGFIATMSTWLSARTRKQSTAILAFFNGLIYHTARKSGLIYKKGGKYRIRRKRIKAFLGTDEQVMACDWVWRYARKFWGADFDKTLIYRLKDALAELGLFTVNSAGHAPGRGKKSLPIKFADFDMLTLIQFYEIAEKVFIDRFGFDAMPDHKGAIVRLLYDAIFRSRRGYNRVPNTDCGLPRTTALDERIADRWAMIVSNGAENVLNVLQRIGGLPTLIRAILDHCRLCIQSRFEIWPQELWGYI